MFCTNIRTTRLQWARWCRSVAVVVLLPALALAATESSDDRHDFANTVLFMRHALAPGTGDPADFTPGDCTTQRNLSQQGRLQAKMIGKRLSQAGIRPTAIYSSQWCRCTETAQLLGLGPFSTHRGLNSYYQGIVDRSETLQLLDTLIRSFAPHSGPYLLVTHQVVITDMTGVFPASGEIVGYNYQSGKVTPFALP